MWVSVPVIGTEVGTGAWMEMALMSP